MKATIVYFSVSGKNGQVAKALDAAFQQQGYTVERAFLKPAKPMGVVTGVLRSVFGRGIELDNPPVIEGHDVLAVVGPVWGSAVCPPVRTFVESVTDLGGKPAINLVCGYNPHQNVVRTINHELKRHNVGRIVSEAVRLRDVDTPEKMKALVERIVNSAISGG